MKKIIVINGSGTSGKDEVAHISKELIVKKTKKTKVRIISSIEAVKDLALLFDWDSRKDNRGRKFLSDLKDAWSLYNNGPFNDIKKKINILDEKFDWLVYIHVREPKEIQKMVDYYDDVKTLLIKRSGVEKFKNHADQEVYEYPYDYIIENNGSLDDLNDSVSCFLKDIKIL